MAEFVDVREAGPVTVKLKPNLAQIKQFIYFKPSTQRSMQFSTFKQPFINLISAITSKLNGSSTGGTDFASILVKKQKLNALFELDFALQPEFLKTPLFVL